MERKLGRSLGGLSLNGSLALRIGLPASRGTVVHWVSYRNLARLVIVSWATASWEDLLDVGASR